MSNKHTSTTRLNPTLALQLAAPHTWPASIFPVLTALALACVHAAAGSTTQISIVMVLVLLAISVLMQGAVNTINDYFDFVKGTDTTENQSDPTDAVLVYNNVNPISVRNLAIAEVACAFALGIYCIVQAGWIPLAIAAIGALVIFLYSGGRTPISYLPIGEAVSGITMGGLITFASYYCMTKSFDLLVFVYALPLILGIALIMLTNNGCDIEKDTQAHRRTLPVLLGHTKTVRLYHAVIYIWTAAVCVIVALWFTNGLIVIAFMLLAIHPLARALLANPLTAQSRPQAFAQCSSLNIALGSFYCAALFASTIQVVAL